MDVGVNHSTSTGNNVSYRQTRIRGIDDGNGQGSGSGGIAFDTQYSIVL